MKPRITFQRTNSGYHWKLTYEPIAPLPGLFRCEARLPVDCKRGIMVRRDRPFDRIANVLWARTIGDLVDFAVRARLRPFPFPEEAAE